MSRISGHGTIKITALCFAMAVFAWGTLFYGNAFYLVAIAERTGWSAAIISGAISASFAACVPSAIIGGWIFDRFGQSWGSFGIVTYGALAMASGVSWLAHVESSTGLYAAYILMGSAYPCLAAPAISAILTQRASASYAISLSVALTGASVGGMVAVPLLVFGREALGFETAAQVLAVTIVLVLLVPAGLILRPQTRSAPQVHASIESSPKLITDVLSRGVFWRIAIGALCSLTTQVGFLAHQLGVLSEELKLEHAAPLITLTAFAAVIGRFWAGAIAHGVYLGRLAATVYLLQSIGIVTVAFASDWISYAVGCSIAGFVVGAVVMLPPMLCREAFDPRIYARAYGLLAAGVYLGGALGSSIAGVIHDLAGRYFEALISLALIGVVGAISVATVSQEQK